MNKETKISFVLPCLNEEKGLQIVVPEIVLMAKKNNLNYEIVLADNNSHDGSVTTFKKLATDLGIIDKTKIVVENNQGYGAVYQAGFNISDGDIFIMADSDGTYDFNNTPAFLREITQGADLVIGNRFSGQMQKGSMPFLNKFLGNPVLSFLVRLFFKVKVHDVHSGMRSMTRIAYKKLNLYTKGMEFASEMIIQASKKNLKVTEININYRNREGHSKLKAFRDGWKHLRFILLYSSDYVFLLPGFFISVFSLAALFVPTWSKFENKIILFSFLGFQMIFFAIFNKFYTITHLGEHDKRIEKMSRFLTIEKMMLLGTLILISGIIFSFFKISIAFILVLAGILTLFSSLSISIIGIKER